MPDNERVLFLSASPNRGADGARLAAKRLGDERAIAAEATRLFTLTPKNAPPRRVVTSLDDVTRGLGLSSATEQRIQDAVGGSHTRFNKLGGSHSAGGARIALMTSLRAADDVPDGARPEIIARAVSYWKQAERTDYGTPTGAREKLRLSLKPARPLIMRKGP